MFYQKISSLIQQQLKYISTACKTAITTLGKISKNIQFQNTHAGFTIFSVHSQHLKSSSSAFRPALSNLWLLLVVDVVLCEMHVGTCHVKESSIYFSSCSGIAKPFN